MYYKNIEITSAEWELVSNEDLAISKSQHSIKNCLTAFLTIIIVNFDLLPVILKTWGCYNFFKGFSVTKLCFKWKGNQTESNKKDYLWISSTENNKQ